MSTAPSGPRPVVSIIVSTSGSWQSLFRCLTALIPARVGVAAEVIVVDDGSTDDTGLALPLMEGLIRHRNDAPAGRAQARNQGAAMARGEHLLFIGDDTELAPGAVTALLHALQAVPGAIAAGPRLLRADGAPYVPAVVVDEPQGDALAAATIREVLVLTPEAFLVTAVAFRAVEGFAGGFETGGEATELSLRLLQAGGRLVRTSAAVVRCHAGPAEPAAVARDEATLARRWPDLLDVALDAAPEDLLTSGFTDSAILMPTRRCNLRCVYLSLIHI